MMRTGLYFAGGAILAATSAAATDLPKSGAYAASIYVSGAGNGCVDYAGTTYAGVLNYGGVDDNHAGLRVPLGASGVVSIQALTAKAGVGTLAPSGTFTWKITSGQGGQSYSGTWSARLSVVDSVSFVADITEHYNGICTEDLTVSLTRVGPHQT